MEHVGGAVFVGGGAHAVIKAEDEVFEELEGFEELIDARVEAAGDGLEVFVGDAVEKPHVACSTDERAGADTRADEHGARIMRVYDVKPNREALRMVEAILGCPS